MVRRNYKITSDQDATIARMSDEMGIDKEQVVQLALDAGLAGVEQLWTGAGKPRGLLAYAKALLEVKEKGIKGSNVRNRA